MKALTVCQPWAWAIVQGIKRIENRPWRTDYRGDLWIHAGRSRRWFAETGLSFPDDSTVPSPSSCLYGAVIGRVRLLDCVPLTDPRVAGDPWASGPWCWILADARPLAEPLFLPGKLMLWNLDLAPPAGTDQPCSDADI